MRPLVSIPVLALALILQGAVLARINLLAGCADLVLLVVAAWSIQPTARADWFWAIAAGLMVGYISHLPLLVPVAGYLAVAGLARLLKRQIWQAPLLANLLVVFAGTLVTNAIIYIVLWFQGTMLSVGESLYQVVLPSLLLNLLVSIPVHNLLADLARALYPAEIET